MANAQLRFDGLNELREQLRNLPAELTSEASTIVDSTAREAEAEIRGEYESHRRSGNLAKRLRVTRVDQGKYSAGALLKSTAPHANLFENGSQARHTDIGANRGSMPPAHVFVPAVVRARRRMFEKLKAMLQRNGLTVSGDA